MDNGLYDFKHDRYNATRRKKAKEEEKEGECSGRKNKQGRENTRDTGYGCTGSNVNKVGT